MEYSLFLQQCHLQDKMSETTNSHLFAVRTTGGQEKVVIRLLETRMRTIKKIREELKGFEDRQISPEEEEKAEELRKQLKSSESQFNVQSILLVDNLKGYIVIEAEDPQQMFNTIQGLRHVKGQLRGEMQFSEIEPYLVKKSTVSELAVDGIVEIIGGPFKGMKATITRVDHEKEEATVILLDAPYQLPVTVDANYLKPSS